MLIALGGMMLIPACAGRPADQQVRSGPAQGRPAPSAMQQQKISPPPPSQAWRPLPVSVRVYPSTRFVKEDDQAILEARIELFDQMGDSIKSSGQVRCELFAVSGANQNDVGTRLYVWDIDLTSIDDQRTFYDPIIRGYVFRLRVDDLAIARHPTLLRIVFQPPEGDRLKSEAVVSSDW